MIKKNWSPHQHTGGIDVKKSDHGKWDGGQPTINF